MSKHTELGDIAITVGSYEKDGKQKKRFRRIGVLMQTDYDDGGKNLWLKLNADALSSSLLILARASMEKGQDAVLCSVFARDDKKPANAPADEPPDDNIPY